VGGGVEEVRTVGGWDLIFLMRGESVLKNKKEVLKHLYHPRLFESDISPAYGRLPLQNLVTTLGSTLSSAGP
jgi:hypothetical protein